MEVINMLKSSKIKANERVVNYCGGRYSQAESFKMGGIGIGKMDYIGGIDLIDHHRISHTLKVNFELLKEGLGLYLRNSENHYVILIRYDELISVSIEKEMDELRIDGFSFFKTMIGRGIDFWKARIFLLEREMVRFNDAYVLIATDDLSVINLKIRRINPDKIVNFFQSSPVSDKVVVALDTYTLVD